MACSEKPVWTDYSEEELKKIKIDPIDESFVKKVKTNWDLVAKPLDGMGDFEKIVSKIGGMTRSELIDISKRAVVIMCADNGIIEEGVSQSGKEVTTMVAEIMVKKQSSVCRMAKVAGADSIPVDIGIDNENIIEGMVGKRVRQGTRNFLKEPAMTRVETIKAIAAGIDIVYDLAGEGYKILAMGELGIGNTTTSSAVAAALLKCDAELVTGRGAGLDDKGLARKKAVIQSALEKYKLYEADALTILSTVGGLDIAGLVGICIGGALTHTPIVLDGVISLASGILAERIMPGVKGYLIGSHNGKEPAIKLLADELGLDMVINARLALGEGTGAVMMFPLLDMALAIYSNSTTFDDISLEQYKRY